MKKKFVILTLGLIVSIGGVIYGSTAKKQASCCVPGGACCVANSACCEKK